MKAVVAVNLGKQYRIGGPQAKYSTFRDTMMQALVAPIKRASNLMHGQAYGAAGLEEEIWALKDINFEVEHGEVVGIIGHNGAGKSTLLKVLSRITEPTTGYADIYGRVGALLEVGTGFHPELTGRENIYLNGAILGMSRAEITRKFDEIVDFAGVEKFIDTPVKHYSSGMGLRLGFSVAAHLEPDILVVDEVLAVGDIQFQQKCLGKMSDVAGEGRTVLFVSHNLAAVRKLCQRVIMLKQGEVAQDGPVDDVVSYYEEDSLASIILDRSGQAQINAFSEKHGIGLRAIASDVIYDDGDLNLSISLEGYTTQSIRRLGFGITFSTGDGILVSRVWPEMIGSWQDYVQGDFSYRFHFPHISRSLMGGDYVISPFFVIPQQGIVFSVDNAAMLDLPPTDPYGVGKELRWRHVGLVPLFGEFHIITQLESER